MVLELSLTGSRDEVDMRSGIFCSKWRLRSSERWGREGPSCEVVGICRGEALPGVEGLFICNGRTVADIGDGETPGGLLFEVEVERCRARDIRKPGQSCTGVSMLPPFLSLRAAASADPFYDAIFDHSPPVGPIRAFWWPATRNGAVPSTVVLFFPGVPVPLRGDPAHCDTGNPGILDFYTNFLTALHNEDKTCALAIMAHSHVGHSPEIHDQHSRQDTGSSLSTQIQGALEAYDAIRYYYRQQTKIVLVGHSVGAWIALQVSLQDLLGGNNSYLRLRLIRC